MFRWPLHATEEATCNIIRRTNPLDVTAYFIGASGLQPRLGTQRGITLCGLNGRIAGRRGMSVGGPERRTAGRRDISVDRLECRTDETFEVGEKEIDHRIATRTTDEKARLLDQLMQRDRTREQHQPRQPERPRVFEIRDDGPLSEPEESKVFSGQLQPRLVLHACPLTKEGRVFNTVGSKQEVVVINLDEGRSSAVAVATGQDDSGGGPSEVPDDELGSVCFR